MTLTVDTRQVKNHKTVCYKPKTEEGYPYADTTYYLSFGSMAIGIGTITKANYREVYARHKFLNANNPLTLKDVEDNIGLITNVAKETRGRWLTRIAKNNFQSILYSLEKEEKHI
tara:strand:- start:275 stop:619 length:345 start_codon:yes stop_codon:yes gene_type:complete